MTRGSSVRAKWFSAIGQTETGSKWELILKFHPYFSLYIYSPNIAFYHFNALQHTIMAFLTENILSNSYSGTVISASLQLIIKGILSTIIPSSSLCVWNIKQRLCICVKKTERATHQLAPDDTETISLFFRAILLVRAILPVMANTAAIQTTIQEKNDWKDEKGREQKKEDKMNTEKSVVGKKRRLEKIAELDGERMKMCSGRKK